MNRHRLVGIATATVLLGAVALAAPVAASAAETITVSGHVTAPADATPFVELLDPAGDPVDDADVDANGDYTLEAVAPGSYTVGFADDEGLYVERYWNGTAAGVVLDDPTQGATYFGLVAGQALTGIDGTLAVISFGGSAPTITGTPAVGRTLELEFGDWADAADLDIAWFRGPVQIDDETDVEYKVQNEDVGQRLHAEILATGDGYEDAAFTTASVLVPGGTLRGTKPKITGLAVTGSVLGVSTGAWTADTKLSYVWMANGTAIPRATKATLKVSSKLAHQRISVAVTGFKKGYALLTLTSARTKRVR